MNPSSLLFLNYFSFGLEPIVTFAKGDEVTGPFSPADSPILAPMSPSFFFLFLLGGYSEIPPCSAGLSSKKVAVIFFPRASGWQPPLSSLC